jgi:hypothetical protein
VKRELEDAGVVTDIDRQEDLDRVASTPHLQTDGSEPG